VEDAKIKFTAGLREIPELLKDIANYVSAFAGPLILCLQSVNGNNEVTARVKSPA
jgi:hypothetical protein